MIYQHHHPTPSTTTTDPPPPTADSCPANCSGRGDCYNGTCLCQIEYMGGGCTNMNLPYIISFSSIYYTLALISTVQLFVCMRSDYLRGVGGVTQQHVPSWSTALSAACRLSTQKLLYLLTLMATVIRALYFTTKDNIPIHWSDNLMSAYYPILLTCFSLLVCYWAEAFHLSDVPGTSNDMPTGPRDATSCRRFLSKSSIAFIIFNALIYSLLLAQIVSTQLCFTSYHHQLCELSDVHDVFNACFAVVMLVVLIFFLIYGVEVYFKVRGAFSIRASPNTAPSTSATSSSRRGGGGGTYGTFGGGKCYDHTTVPHQKLATSSTSAARNKRGSVSRSAYSGELADTDATQLHMSRVGLVTQAAFQLIAAVLLMWDAVVPGGALTGSGAGLGGAWQWRWRERNIYDMTLRVVEVGVAVWFPCVLWNCNRPDKLWILNPRRLLLTLASHHQRQQSSGGAVNERTRLITPAAGTAAVISVPPGETDGATGLLLRDGVRGEYECWICYDKEAGEDVTGGWIAPCLCKGDVRVVHHNCLRTWLLQCDTLHRSCPVCGSEYRVHVSSMYKSVLDVLCVQPHSVPPLVYTCTVVAVCVLLLPVLVCVTFTQYYAHMHTYTKIITIGVTIIIYYLCFRFLGISARSVYERARERAVRIFNLSAAVTTSTTTST